MIIIIKYCIFIMHNQTKISDIFNRIKIFSAYSNKLISNEIVLYGNWRIKTKPTNIFNWIENINQFQIK